MSSDDNLTLVIDTQSWDYFGNDAYFGIYSSHSELEIKITEIS